MGVSPENPQDSCVSLTRVPRATTLPRRFQTPCPHGGRSPQGSRMQHGTRRGRIEVIAGVMFSGRSEELIRRVRRAVIAKKRVQVFKSHLDARYAGVYAISSHDERTVDAIPVDSADQLLLRLDPAAHVVAIDEAQFLDPGIV